jgi:hypothetical protein
MNQSRAASANQVDGPTLSEAEHFSKCADLRDLGQVFEHLDDGAEMPAVERSAATSRGQAILKQKAAASRQRRQERADHFQF